MEIGAGLEASPSKPSLENMEATELSFTCVNPRHENEVVEEEPLVGGIGENCNNVSPSEQNLFSKDADEKFLVNFDENGKVHVKNLIQDLNEIYKEQPKVIERRSERNSKEAPLLNLVTDYLSKKDGTLWETQTLKQQSYIKKSTTASHLKGHFRRRILHFF